MKRLSVLLIATLVVTAIVAPAMAGGVAATSAQAEPACEYPVSLTDATGETVTLEEPPERIVTLNPSDANTIFEIGADDRLVGMPVGDGTSRLDAEGQTDITEDDGFTVDSETVVGLEPDIVLAANVSSVEQVDQLRDAGLTVYHFPEATSLEDVAENVAITGTLSGECDGATETLTWMDQRLDLLESAVADAEHPTVYYKMGDGFTAGSGTFQHETMTAAGLDNIATAADIEKWGIISNEVVVEEDPDWILRTSGPFQPEIPESLEDTTAVQNEQFVTVDSNDFSQPAPRIVFAMETLVETVHPEAYDEIANDLETLDADYEAGEFLPATEEETDDDGADDDMSDDSSAADDDEPATTADDDSGATDDADTIPGFGVPVAVAAVLSLLGFTLRRR
ncbi:PGF-CTERM-anchored ABC transporter substrate-binding protein [Natrialbaceae archaeon A-CW2]|uniref:PGF-CTERM-anchored ABC transporter substrate-binding protein n=1 Tax=Natronosalvus amylolyticus TaxID=2961994 RepID=UPI0020C9F46E|nr:PGF-CTERM-anchored ABC transporter substrate-binding protein [Natronosalvus amylolyticus]